MQFKEVNGTYGSNKTKTAIYTATNSNGATWYAVEGSKGVNRTYDEIEEGTDVEGLKDFDFFTWSKNIESLEDLEEAINN